MSPRASKSTPTPDAELDFETALARLDAIVRELESGTLPLEAALARFEEGTRLTRFCRERLHATEARVLELLEDGSLRPVAPE